MNSVINDKLQKFFFEELTNQHWSIFFRQSIGILLILHLLAVLPDFEVLYSSTGYIPSDIMDVFVPNYLITLPKIVNYLQSFGIGEFDILLGFKIIYIVLGILLILGKRTQVIAFILLLMQIAMVKGSGFYSYGIDFFVSMSLVYLILIPTNTKEKTPYRRLFQIHLSILYFLSGLGKVVGFNWWNGESIWKAINLPFANQDFQFNFLFLVENPILLIIIGWTTIIIEIAYPIFIWNPKTRNLWLFLTIAMHIGIALVLNLYFFSTMMIIWNLTNFYNFKNKLTT